MNTAELLSDLNQQGVSLIVRDGKLVARPKDNIKPEQVEQLRQHKAEVIQLLQKQKPKDASEEVPQQGYALGYGCSRCSNRLYYAVAVWEMSELPESSTWTHEHRLVTRWQCEYCSAVYEIIGGSKGPQPIN